MNIFYASNQERQLQSMKQRRFKSILEYNMGQMQRKKIEKQQHQRQTKERTASLNEEALNTLMMDRAKEQQKRVNQREMLKDSYERQMRLREERGRAEKHMEMGYVKQLEQHQEYQEQKRMAHLARIYNRVSYHAVPYQSNPSDNHYEARRRIRTQAKEEESGRYVNGSVDARLGTAQESGRSGDHSSHVRQERVPGKIADVSWQGNNSHPRAHDSLDDLNIDAIRYPQKALNE